MLIYPAIDLYNGKAVRLYKGNYEEMTVYSDDPFSVALDFKKSGAECIHLVDLQGAKSGETVNQHVVWEIAQKSGLFVEVGGGIRDMETISSYLDNGVNRVILGTAAVNNPEFTQAAYHKYQDCIAVGVDIKDGKVAIRGWTEVSDFNADDFFEKMIDLGIRTFICTDITKDGAMNGTNHDLYRHLHNRFDINLIASGGVSDLEDVKKLAALQIHGAIIGKAYYTGAINLRDAIEVAK